MTQATSTPSKPWWESTTLQGIAVSVAGQILAALEANGTIPPGSAAISGTLIGHIVSAAGLMMAVIGRLKAGSTLTATK